MTDHQFRICWTEAKNYSDPDAYISGLSLSIIWDDDSDDISAERIDQLRRIWDVQHMTMREIRASSGLSQVKFSAHFLIPRRTVEDWDAGLFAPPDYVKVLIARQLGLLF